MSLAWCGVVRGCSSAVRRIGAARWLSRASASLAAAHVPQVDVAVRRQCRRLTGSVGRFDRVQRRPRELRLSGCHRSSRCRSGRPHCCGRHRPQMGDKARWRCRGVVGWVCGCDTSSGVHAGCLCGGPGGQMCSGAPVFAPVNGPAWRGGVLPVR